MKRKELPVRSPEIALLRKVGGSVGAVNQLDACDGVVADVDVDRAGRGGPYSLTS